MYRKSQRITYLSSDPEKSEYESRLKERDVTASRWPAIAFTSVLVRLSNTRTKLSLPPDATYFPSVLTATLRISPLWDCWLPCVLRRH